jgi:hypothetical protein
MGEPAEPVAATRSDHVLTSVLYECFGEQVTETNGNKRNHDY